MPASLFERARAELRAGLGATTSASLVRRSVTVDSVASAVSQHPAGAGDAGQAPVHGSLTSREWDELVDEVVRRIESRVAVELARRGRRSTPRIL